MTSRVHTYGLLIALVAAGCDRAEPAGSALKTDLYDNDSVKATVDAQKKPGAPHCKFTAERKRVIVTGFALFGDPFNISGIVSMSMAKESFFPSKLDLDAPQSTYADRFGKVWKHAEAQTANGVGLKQRTLTIDDKAYEVCFLYLDVKWDQAAAIILNESSLFKPDLVVMMGMNGAEPTRALFESGAINSSTQYAGFESNGQQNGMNLPTSPGGKVLPNLAQNQKVGMTWDASKLAEANAELVKSIGGGAPGYKAAVGYARIDNNYVCNNVSITVAVALYNIPVQLAGGKIKIEGMSFGTKVGFLHLPSTSSKAGRADNGEHVFGWTRVVANTIKTSLGG